MVGLPDVHVWRRLSRGQSAVADVQAAAYFALAAPAMQRSAHLAAAAHLLLKLLEDVLCEDAYLADMASLSYQVNPEAWEQVQQLHYLRASMLMLCVPPRHHTDLAM